LQAFTTKYEIAKTAHFFVYCATRNRDGSEVALKVLVNGGDASIRSRFRNEVRLLARLDHPNIIRVIDQDVEASTAWVCTPLYASNLASAIADGNLANFEDRVSVFDSLLNAVEYAHAQGVIHRDIKPANVLLNNAREVVLIDFNISRSSDEEATRHTRIGQALGTPFFMAPEQLHAPSTADERADVFSLGLILYVLFDGKVGSSALYLDHIPQFLQSFVKRSTEPKTGDRYQSVAEMKRVWNLLRDSSARQSELVEISNLALKSNLTPAEIEELSNLLAAYVDDKDFLDQFFVSADRTVIQLLCGNAAIDFLVAVRAWLGFVGSQSWPFAYTDKIAERCKLLHDSLEDASYRGEIVRATLALGNAHHRYKVWRIVVEMLQRYKDTSSAEYLASVLASAFAVDDFEGLREYVDAKSTHRSLRSLVFGSASDAVDQ
jgi:eukaryotic-like serine/threonine-protein kinase